MCLCLTVNDDPEYSHGSPVCCNNRAAHLIVCFTLLVLGKQPRTITYKGFMLDFTDKKNKHLMCENLTYCKYWHHHRNTVSVS